MSISSVGESGLSVELAPLLGAGLWSSSPPLPGKAVSDAITRGPWNVREPAGVTTSELPRTFEKVFISEVLKRNRGRLQKTS
jgi:hypothetical protein